MRLLEKEDLSSRILDIGCCAGSLLLTLEASGFSGACGIDTNPKAVEQCRNSKSAHLLTLND